MKHKSHSCHLWSNVNYFPGERVHSVSQTGHPSATLPAQGAFPTAQLKVFLALIACTISRFIHCGHEQAATSLLHNNSIHLEVSPHLFSRQKNHYFCLFLAVVFARPLNILIAPPWILPRGCTPFWQRRDHAPTPASPECCLLIQKWYLTSQQVIQVGHCPEANLSLFPDVVPKAPDHYSCRLIKQKGKIQLRQKTD